MQRGESIISKPICTMYHQQRGGGGICIQVAGSTAALLPPGAPRCCLLADTGHLKYG